MSIILFTLQMDERPEEYDLEASVDISVQDIITIGVQLFLNKMFESMGGA